MKDMAARIIVGTYGAVLCGMLGAGVRGDDQLQTPGRDIATGAAIVGTAMAVKWALQRLDMEMPA